MNGVCTNENEVTIGHFNKSFAFNIFSGQSARIMAFGDQTFSSLQVSNCIIGSPPATPVLYMAFLSLVTKEFHQPGSAADEVGSKQT